jgi:hypothetical protein
MAMNYVVAAWPTVKIVEGEPLTALVQQPTWRQDETTFHILLAQQIGRPVQRLQADVQWQVTGWKDAMVKFNNYAHQQNLGFAVIYDGSALARTDADWVSSAVSNFEAVEGELGITPDMVLFTSWDLYPSHNMPETSPSAQTWLINRYVRPRSLLQAQFVGGGAKGKLTTADGKPIPNVAVNAYKPGVDFSKPLPVTVVQGVVPATAVQALIGVRVNSECGCSGVNDILFGGITYQETQGGSSIYTYTFSTTPGRMNGAVFDGEVVGGTRVSRVISMPGQGLDLNSGTFPVTGNAQYQFSIPAATVGGLGWYGNVILIFIDSSGNGNRVTVVPAPGKALMSTAMTAADGTFALFPLPRSVDGPQPVTVEFDGNGGTWRSSIWMPLH